MNHRALSAGLLAACLSVSPLAAQSGCVQDSCLVFDGLDDFAFVGHAPSLLFNSTDTFTVEAWVQTTVVPPPGPPWVGANPLPTIIEKWDNTCTTPYPFALRLDVGGAVKGLTFDATNCNVAQALVLSQTMAVTDGAWHHVAYCRDAAGDHHLYIDGVLVATDPGFVSAPTLNTVPMYLGRRAPGGGFPNHWQGSIDEIRVSTVCRYGGDFRPSSYNYTDADTVVLLHCDEGMGSVSLDDSGLNNHAQLGLTAFPEAVDPTWGPGVPQSRIDGLKTSVNGGPFDASFKTFAGGDFLVFGVDPQCAPGLTGRGLALVLNLGLEAQVAGITPHPALGFLPLPGFVSLNTYSFPPGNAILMGDGINAAGSGVGIPFGLGTLSIGDSPYAIPVPPGVFPPGFDLRIQGAYALFDVSSIAMGVTNPILLQAQ